MIRFLGKDFCESIGEIISIGKNYLKHISLKEDMIIILKMLLKI